MSRFEHFLHTPSLRLLAGTVSVAALLWAPLVWAQTAPAPGTPGAGGALAAPQAAHPAALGAPATPPAAQTKGSDAPPAGSPKVGGVTGSSAGQAPAAKDPATQPSTGKPQTMGQEGLAVHGLWTIDIRNPDGTLARHVKFENSLNFSGGALLIGLLSGQLSPGNIMVALGPNGTGACVGAQYQWCAITQSLTTLPATSYCATEYTCVAGLTVTAAYGPPVANGPYTLTLAGSITANQTGQIGSVYTIMNSCGASTYNASSQNPSSPTTFLPTDCVNDTGSSAFFSPLTNTNITPISVNNGQLIQVQVVISFS